MAGRATAAAQRHPAHFVTYQRLKDPLEGNIMIPSSSTLTTNKNSCRIDEHIHQKAALVLDQIEAVEESNRRRRRRQKQGFFFATTPLPSAELPTFQPISFVSNDGVGQGKDLVTGASRTIAGSPENRVAMSVDGFRSGESSKGEAVRDPENIPPASESTPTTIATTPSTESTESSGSGGGALADDLTSCEDEEEGNGCEIDSHDGDGYSHDADWLKKTNSSSYGERYREWGRPGRFAGTNEKTMAINDDEQKEELLGFHQHRHYSNDNNQAMTTMAVVERIPKEKLIDSLQQCYKSLISVVENAALQRRMLELELASCKKQLSDTIADNVKLSALKSQLEKQILLLTLNDENARQQRHNDDALRVEKHLNSLIAARQVAVDENLAMKHMLLKNCCSSCLKKLPYRRGKLASTSERQSIPDQPSSVSRPTWQSSAQQLLSSLAQESHPRQHLSDIQETTPSSQHHVKTYRTPRETRPSYSHQGNCHLGDKSRSTGAGPVKTRRRHRRTSVDSYHQYDEHSSFGKASRRQPCGHRRVSLDDHPYNTTHNNNTIALGQPVLFPTTSKGFSDSFSSPSVHANEGVEKHFVDNVIRSTSLADNDDDAGSTSDDVDLETSILRSDMRIIHPPLDNGRDSNAFGKNMVPIVPEDSTSAGGIPVQANFVRRSQSHYRRGQIATNVTKASSWSASSVSSSDSTVVSSSSRKAKVSASLESTDGNPRRNEQVGSSRRGLGRFSWTGGLFANLGAEVATHHKHSHQPQSSPSLESPFNGK